MYKITAKVEDIKTTEGCYKNKLIAEKHKRRLEKRYPGFRFRLEIISKENNELRTFYAVKRLKEGGKI